MKNGVKEIGLTKSQKEYMDSLVKKLNIIGNYKIVTDEPNSVGCKTPYVYIDAENNDFLINTGIT